MGQSTKGYFSIQFGMNHNANWRTDEFFRGLGGSTTNPAVLEEFPAV